MSQDHPSKLTFSVEESVWLNKGQEIDEILSMSLEPEISIHEYADHVSIRGGLKLSGEYRPQEHDQPMAVEEGSLRDQVAFRSIEQVSVSDDGIAKIQHQFPIDVTIPLNRINNLEDIYVLVESFDYDLPERGCIQLTADVSISGMTMNQREDKQQAPVVSEVKQEEQVVEPFQFETRKITEEPEIKAEQEPLALQSDSELVTEEQVNQEQEIATIEAREEFIEVPKTEELELEAEREAELLEQKDETNDIQKQKSPQIEMNSRKEEQEEKVERIDALSSFFTKKEAQPALQIEEDEQGQNEKVGEERPDVIEEGNIIPMNQAEEIESEGAKINIAPLKKLVNERSQDRQLGNNNQLADTREDQVSDGELSSQESRKEENALYLTKMLTKGEEEFSKLRMCIIQANESLETIAERYEVSPSQLVRVNRLDDETVEEGQILYIPVTS